jgi:hypothetical protein
MGAFLQPPPEVVALFAMKKFIYLAVIALLALVRAGIGRGLSRWLALIALSVAATGLAARYVPPLAGIYQGPVYANATRITLAAQEMGVLLAASVPLALSGMVPGRRWWAIDALHALVFVALFGLWWVTR